MTSGVPHYSIVVPTYRRRAPLARCIAAINALEYPRDRFELLIVDDGSPTPPADLLTALDPAIDARLICAQHGGPASARNIGASFARGDYLVFTDDDCAPRPDWLAAIDRRLENGGGAAVGGRTVNILADDIYAEASQGIVDFLYEYYGSEQTPGQFFTTNNLVLPRAGFLDVGGFDEGFQRAAAEDRDLCERWQRRGFALEYDHDMVVEHAHALGFGRFNRLHFNYGRGAFDLHRSRARRGQPSLRLEPVRFYWGLVTHPLRRGRAPRRRGIVLAALHLWSQVAYAAGYFYERIRRGWAVQSGELPRRQAVRPRVITRREVATPSHGSVPTAL